MVTLLESLVLSGIATILIRMTVERGVIVAVRIIKKVGLITVTLFRFREVPWTPFVDASIY